MNGGPNQHYIPKFSLRAFGILKRRVEIWRFGLDEPPVRRRIERTGSDANFCSFLSVDGHPTLDDTIPALESQLSQTLREVRSKSPEEPIDPIEATAIGSIRWAARRMFCPPFGTYHKMSPEAPALLRQRVPGTAQCVRGGHLGPDGAHPAEDNRQAVAV